MKGTVWGLALLLCGLLQTPARATELVVLVDTSTELPWAQLQDEGISSGIHHDVGEALAARLGLAPRFLVLPRRRIAGALERGEGDLICAVLPPWLPGSFDWSHPFLPDVELVLSLRSSPRPSSLAALTGQPIGTVAGFVYPNLQQQLGGGFVRDDAPNAGANLRKLNLGRVQHATSSQLFVDYQRRQGLLTAALHPPLVIGSYLTQCAVSRRGHVTVGQVNQAIQDLVGDGSLQRLLARYR